MFVLPASQHVIPALLDLLNPIVYYVELALLGQIALFVILDILLQHAINVLQATIFLQMGHQLFAADAQRLCRTACSALLAQHVIYARLAILQEHVTAAF